MARLQPVARAVADLASRVADGGRLARGRLYQRQGNVFDVLVEAGEVGGTVQGTRSQGYRATFTLPEAGADVLRALRSCAFDLGVSASLVDDPDQLRRLVDTAVESRVRLVPHEDDLRFDCTCPDWGDPCKHGVALILAFAEAIDHDPGTLLLARGIDIRALLAGSPYDDDEDGDRSIGGRVEVGDGSPPEQSEEVAAAMAQFFTGSMPVGELQFSSLPPIDDPFPRVNLVVEGVDAAPTFSAALAAIAEGLQD